VSLTTCHLTDINWNRPSSA